MTTDRNFDDMSHKFSKNIYGTTKGQIREAIIWQDIQHILSQFPDNKQLTILDAGGGQGQLACRLSALGHRVIICDISENMLELAKQNADLNQVTLEYIHCSIQDLTQHINDKFDLVMCHAVLEWVNDGFSILDALKQYLAPDGVLSLMFYNYHGLLFKTITLGNFGYVDTGLKKRKRKTLSPDHPREPQQVYQWLDDLDLNIVQKTGIRVFHDYMLDKSKQKNCFAELLALEKQYCRQEPYLSLARYIHVVAKQ